MAWLEPYATASPKPAPPGRSPWQAWRDHRRAVAERPYPGPFQRIRAAVALVLLVAGLGVLAAGVIGASAVALLFLIDRALG